MENQWTVGDLGEQGLLALLQQFCPAEVVGDDAALVTLVPGQRLVVTTDVLVEGVHFSDRTTPPHAVGWRAAAANLSDLAAMGAEGLGITVGLSLPPHCPLAWVRALYQGMADCLGTYGMVLLGGDLCQAEQRAIAITALGQVPNHWAMARGTAQPGDALVVTGPHGGSRAGLALLLGEETAALEQLKQLTPAQQGALIRQHQYPQPRLDLVPGLRQLQRRVSGMDSSDGLADALVQICRASGVGASVVAEDIPLAPDGALDGALNWALYGGEDFELVLALAPDAAAQFCRQAGPGARVIGQVTGGDRVLLRHGDGREQPLVLDRGFQHFTTS